MAHTSFCCSSDHVIFPSVLYFLCLGLTSRFYFRVACCERVVACSEAHSTVLQRTVLGAEPCKHSVMHIASLASSIAHNNGAARLQRARVVAGRHTTRPEHAQWSRSDAAPMSTSPARPNLQGCQTLLRRLCWLPKQGPSLPGAANPAASITPALPAGPQRPGLPGCGCLPGTCGCCPPRGPADT